jgi:nucleoside transporter
MWGLWFVTAGTYLMEGLDFSGRQVGALYASFSIGASISPLLLGFLADRLFSTERLLSLLHFMGAILLLCLPSVASFSTFYIVLFAYVICYVPTFSLSNALSFHHIKDIKKDFPAVRVWGTIGWIAAGLLISYLEIEDKATPFYIAAFASLIQAIFCLTLPKTPPSLSKQKGIQPFISPEIKHLFRDTSFTVFIICVTLVCIPRSYYYSFVNPFLNEIGVENAAGKMALGQVSEIVLMLLLPLFLARFKFKTLIFFGIFAWGSRYGLLILGDIWQMESFIIIAILLHAPAFIFSNLTVQMYIDTKVPDELRSTAQGFFTLISMGIFALIGSLIAGETVSRFTQVDGSHIWTNVWMLPFIFGVGTALIFYLTFHPKKKTEEAK